MPVAFNEWLTGVLEYRKMSIRQFAISVGVTPEAAGYWVSGERTPRQDKIPAIAGALKIPPIEVEKAFLGRGEIEYTPDDPDIPVIVEGYNDLAPQDKELVKGVIERLRNQSRRQSIGGQRADDGDATRQQEDGA